MNRDELDSQIAVIGLSGRFPKSKDLDGGGGNWAIAVT